MAGVRVGVLPGGALRCGQAPLFEFVVIVELVVTTASDTKEDPCVNCLWNGPRHSVLWVVWAGWSCQSSPLTSPLSGPAGKMPAVLIWRLR